MGHVQSAEPLALRRLARYVATRAPKTVTIHEPYGTSYEIEVGAPKG